VKDYLLKLDVKRDSADPDSKEFQELDSRSSDMEQSVESWKANRQHGKWLPGLARDCRHRPLQHDYQPTGGAIQFSENTAIYRCDSQSRWASRNEGVFQPMGFETVWFRDTLPPRSSHKRDRYWRE